MKFKQLLMAVTLGLVWNMSIYADDFNLQGYDSGKKSQSATIPTPSNQLIHQYANQLFHSPEDPIMGNPNGSVTLVEFFDYRCIHCINMTSIINNAIKKNPNLRVVLKEFPIFGGISIDAALAALAANNQGKFTPFHDALMNAAGEINQNKITAIATELGINNEKFKTDMQSSAVEQQINTTQQLGKNLLLRATPAIFIGKTSNTGANAIDFILGEVTPSQLQKLINMNAK